MVPVLSVLACTALYWQCCQASRPTEKGHKRQGAGWTCVLGMKESFVAQFGSPCYLVLPVLPVLPELYCLLLLLLVMPALCGSLHLVQNRAK